MKTISGEAGVIRVTRCLGLIGVALAALSACATLGAPADPYKLVLNAPGLETVPPKVVIVYDDYSQIVDRSTWNADNAAWPKATLVFSRVKENFQGTQVYGDRSSLPELIRKFFPGEWTTLRGGGQSKNILGTLDHQRFRWKFDIECIFVKQGIDRFSDQVEVIGAGQALGDMVVRGWYCVGPDEPNRDAAFRGFVHGIGIQGWAVP